MKHECNQKRRCVFCGTEEKRLLYDWERGVYLNEHSCMQKHSCRRCDHEETFVSHTLIPETPDIMRCGRCGEIICMPYGYHHRMWMDTL